jgi:plastocyanin
MRFYKLTLAASVLALGACGGNKDAATTDTAAAAPAAGATMTDSSSMAAPAAGTAGAAGTTGAAAGGTASMAPITGKTHEVKMIGDAKGYRFEPANVTVKAGDVVKYVNVSGGPHNAAFSPEEVPDDVEAVLSKNMPDQMAPLQGALLVNPNETYSISFAGVKPGSYNYFCAPHAAMNMKGVITVQ